MKSCKTHFYAVGTASMLLSLLFFGAAVAENPGYVETIESWQAEHEVNLKWFPVDPRYKVKAKFTPHDVPDADEREPSQGPYRGRKNYHDTYS